MYCLWAGETCRCHPVKKTKSLWYTGFRLKLLGAKTKIVGQSVVCEIGD